MTAIDFLTYTLAFGVLVLLGLFVFIGYRILRILTSLQEILSWKNNVEQIVNFLSNWLGKKRGGGESGRKK
ncbi:MAG: hypothetical protein Q8Q24_01270 [bacterium]|nr:hypothetical protein [bacterium]